jgi:hypothetical protein
MPQRANGYGQSSGFVSDSSLNDGSTATGYTRTLTGSGQVSEVTGLLDLGVSGQTVSKLRLSFAYSDVADDPLWEYSNSLSGPWTGIVFSSFPFYPQASCSLLLDTRTRACTPFTARYVRVSLRNTDVSSCGSSVLSLRELEAQDSSGTPLSESTGYTLSPALLGDVDGFYPLTLILEPFRLGDADGIYTPAVYRGTMRFLAVTPLDDSAADGEPVVIVRMPRILPVPVCSDVERDVVPVPLLLPGGYTIYPDLFGDGDGFLGVTLAHTGGVGHRVLPAPVADTDQDGELLPDLYSAGNLRLRFSRDNLGAHWGTEIPVAQADSESCGGAFLGWGYGVLYTRTNAAKQQIVYWKTSKTPRDWSGSAEVDTGLRGKVWGLAQRYGLLVGILDKSVIQSLDQGQTWRVVSAIPFALSDSDRGIVCVGDIFYAVECVSTGLRHYASLDGGKTWV